MTCKFDVNGECTALVCYSDEECNARNKNGYPQYDFSDKEKQ